MTATELKTSGASLVVLSLSLSPDPQEISKQTDGMTIIIVNRCLNGLMIKTPYGEMILARWCGGLSRYTVDHISFYEKDYISGDR